MNAYAHLPRRIAIVAFEGPDRYAFVGGLAVRVTELSRALGELDFDVDLIFVGDPLLEPVEQRGNVRLRRWCQWISQHHVRDVYDGEVGKIADMTQSVPRFLVDDYLQRSEEPALIVFEDWQVAPAAIRFDALARERGVRHRAIAMWNANNTYGFETIDFGALARAATLTAVSRYMKFEIGLCGEQALVIPNGIPAALPEVDRYAATALVRDSFGRRRVLLKVGRFDPDKRWMQAIDALAMLRDARHDVQLIVRGGREAYAEEVFARAASHGLRVEHVAIADANAQRIADAAQNSSADIVNLTSFLPDEALFTLYAAADAVLANSGKEPFGLVGLEVMAAGGIAVCGSTGEDYARAFDNAIVCDSGDGAELAAYLDELFADEALSEHLRAAAPETARRFTWPSVLRILDAKVAYARTKGMPR